MITYLFRWKAYLENEKNAEIDFTIPSLTKPEGDFQKQLEVLSTALIKENVEMLHLLQKKEEEYQKRELERKKKASKKASKESSSSREK